MKTLILCSLLLFSSVASAGIALAPMAQGFKPFSTNVHITSTGGIMSTSFRGLDAANSAQWGSRAVPITKSSLASIARARMGAALLNPWLGAAMIAASVVFDPGTGEVVQTSYAPGVVPPTNAGDAQLFCALAFCSTDATDLNSCVASPVSSSCWSEWSDWYGNYTVWYLPAGTPASCTSGFTFVNGSGCAGDVASDHNLSDDEMMDILNSLSPNQLNDLMTNPSTNRLDDIQPLNDAATDLTNDFNATHDEISPGVPDTSTTATVDLPNGDTGAESVDDVPPVEEPQENLCEQMPNIMACMDVGTQEGAVPVATTVLPSSYSPESLGSNASCPSPESMNLNSGSIAFSYQPICDGATMIKPLFIAICSLFAVFIVSGGLKT